MNIIKHIPNTVTSMNLLCGSLGVIAALEGNISWAFLLMLAAVVCDFFDGFIARMLHAHSAVGKELDSLADLVSFGLLPAVMLHCMVKALGNDWLSYVPMLIPVFSALRLAKFNIDEAQTENFLGLPTPACAMIIGSFSYYLTNSSESIMLPWLNSPVFIILSTAALCGLMVSRIPMFSMKFKRGAKAESPIQRMRITAAGFCFFCILIVFFLGLNWSMIILLTFVLYIIINLIGNLTIKKN